jgi:hypothetical protein
MTSIPTLATTRAADCDTVVVATQIDLRHLVRIPQATRVRYDLDDLPGPTLRGEIEACIAGRKAGNRWSI